MPRQPPFVSSPRIRGWVWSKSSRVIWSGGTAAYHSDVPVSRRSIRTPPLRCVTRITRSALSYSCRRIDRRRYSFARPAFVTTPTTSRSPIVWRAARIDRWNSWWASRSSTSSSRNIVGRQARTTNPACVSSIFLSSISNINVVIWWHVNARATCTRGRTSSRVSPARFPRATIPCGATEFPPSRKTTSWPSITARTQSKVVRWNTKSEPLSIRVTLPASKDPRIRSRVGTEVVRAGREIARSSGTGTRAGSTTRAMESSPRFEGDRGGDDPDDVVDEIIGDGEDDDQDEQCPDEGGIQGPLGEPGLAAEETVHDRGREEADQEREGHLHELREQDAPDHGADQREDQADDDAAEGRAEQEADRAPEEGADHRHDGRPEAVAVEREGEARDDQDRREDVRDLGTEVQPRDGGVGHDGSIRLAL